MATPARCSREASRPGSGVGEEEVVLVLVLVVEVGANKESAVVKVGESSGLSGAVERSIPVFKSDSPVASLVGERGGEEQVDSSSTLSVSSTLMIVAWCGVGGAGGATACKYKKNLRILAIVVQGAFFSGTPSKSVCQ